MVFISTQTLRLGVCLLSAFAIEKVAANLVFTNSDLSGITAGAPFNLTWSGASGTTTLTLVNGTENGASSNVNTVDVILCMCRSLHANE